MNNIGENIRIAREKAGLTQDELAKKLGYKTRSSIAKIENGTNDIPQSKIVFIAEALDTTPAIIMGWGRELDNLDWKVHELYPDFNPKDGYISDQVPTSQKPKLRSLSRLENSEFTPEEDEQILDFINYIRSKRGE